LNFSARPAKSTDSVSNHQLRYCAADKDVMPPLLLVWNGPRTRTRSHVMIASPTSNRMRVCTGGRYASNLNNVGDRISGLVDVLAWVIISGTGWRTERDAP